MPEAGSSASGTRPPAVSDDGYETGDFDGSRAVGLELESGRDNGGEPQT